MISESIKFKEHCNVLDIGCGVGRWGDEFVKRNINRYIGIDFSESLLKIAKENFSQDARFSFFYGKFQNLKTILRKNNIKEVFDYYLVNGVFLYINDYEINGCLQAVADLMQPGSVIYIKEGIGSDRRFTLQDFDSKELGGVYNAIYRSKTEWDELINLYFPLSQFEMIKNGPIWPKDMENRKETLQYFWIIKKTM